LSNIINLSLALIVVCFGCVLQKGPDISLVLDVKLNAPLEHGIAKVEETLSEKNISFEKVSSLDSAKGASIIVAGLAPDKNDAASLLRARNKNIPDRPEALTIWKAENQNKLTWVVCGFDDRGLMYGLLDVADRIRWSDGQDKPLQYLREVSERPDVATRAISLYTMNRAYWETRFYDEAYWTKYLDMLVRNRFNSMVVIFGYENGGFLAPCYPYFFDVDGFPEVTMERISAEEQQRNLAALNRLIDMAHDRGIDFKVGIWDHIYRGGVQRGGTSEAELAKQSGSSKVLGLDEKNLRAYTKKALTKFIELVPALDGIQFRMHYESGLKKEEMESFWTEVFQMIKERAPNLRLDLRAKDMPESIIESAQEIAVNFGLTTKYWMEQMGLPFHPTHINRQNQHDRRHGYADMLKYPKSYAMHWKMWSGGTQRILLWGSPGYARRFMESTHLYDGIGFEVNEPLATKMETQPHDAIPFKLLGEEYQYYDYEFERYWHFFQVFGRLGYNLETPSDIWEKEFNRRFGPQAGPLIEQAINEASWILPRIVASVYPYSKFPTTRGWAEKQRLGDLPDYAQAEGSDIQQFASFDEEARLLIKKGESAKILPSATRLWFAHTADRVLKLVAEAEILVTPEENKEFVSTTTDLRILAHLARYHASRIRAAINYRIHVHTQDRYALDDAIASELEAIRAWRDLVTAAGDVYAENLMLGVRETEFMGMIHRQTGHWKDELGYLEKGMEALKLESHAMRDASELRISPAYEEANKASNADYFQISHMPVITANAGASISIMVEAEAPAGIKWVRLRYRSVNQQLDYQTLELTVDGKANLYQTIIPSQDIDPTFDFMYFFEMMDNNGHGFIYPDLHRETPYYVVELNR